MLNFGHLSFIERLCKDTLRIALRIPDAAPATGFVNNGKNMSWEQVLSVTGKSPAV
jgi:hypothetical protein